jgi:AraC-like DNA-binding protein
VDIRNTATESQAGDLGAGQGKLAQKIARLTEGVNSLTTAIPALTLYRWEAPTEPTSYVLEQSICLIAQGAKRVLLGEEEYTYDANSFLLTSLGLPLVANIIEASKKKPYLGLTLELDQRAIAQLMLDSDLPQPRAQRTRRGMAIGGVTLPLLNAFQRLLDLLDRPEDIPILAPLVQREILYYLLVGDQGPRLRQIAAAGSRSHQIARAIDWLRDNFTQQLRVDDLAAETGMSTSTFHHHFRALTAMSPLQFQKNLRLNQARSLMLTEHMDAATAAFEVGYESPSQFNREYSRRFGAPPLRDIKSLRQMTAGGNG